MRFAHCGQVFLRYICPPEIGEGFFLPLFFEREAGVAQLARAADL